MTDNGPWRLERHPGLEPPGGPVAVIVLDGVGLAPPGPGNAFHLARTPFLDGILQGPLFGRLLAHGTAVGMPSDDDMGNSEVGHNAMGAGRIFDQGAKLVNSALASGAVFEGDTWRWLLEATKAGGTLHLLGLWSDGNVHSHVAHAYALLDRALADGVRRIRFHVLLDGRDVGETSALEYLEPLEARTDELRRAGRDVAIASGGGRMITTMDRYEADWSVVERGWRAHVEGDGRLFPSASAAVRAFRAEVPGISDQNLPPFVVAGADGAPAGPVGTIADGDAVVLFNFRGDRAIEVTRAFETAAGAPFPFHRRRVPSVRFAGMMRYDGDLGLPSRFLVEPPRIDRTASEYLVRNGLRILAGAETQKFGHVTYFWNGNRSGRFDPDLERYVEVPSDRVVFSERPWMKAAELTDAVLAAVDEHRPHLVRVNYANGDMVGHTGVLRAAILAMEAVDLSLERLVRGLLARQARVVVTADHGNCEAMIEVDKKTGALVPGSSPEGWKASTSHTLNPVPFVAFGPGLHGFAFDAGLARPGIANLAATYLNLLGFCEPEGYEPGLLIPTS